MSEIVETRYVLAVKDLAASCQYYQNVLGLRLDAEYPGWAFLSRDSFYVMLGECPDSLAARDTGDHAYFAYLQVTDAGKLFEEFKANGARFVKDLTDEPWQMREFGIMTPDGHRIMFGQELTQ